MSISHGLDIAKQALAFTELAQQSVGSNISGAGKPGYSRRTIGATAADTGGDLAGAATDSFRVLRMRDALADAQLRGASQAQSESQSAAGALDDIETALNPLGAQSLPARLDAFRAGLVELGNDPADRNQRGLTVQSALNLADSVNTGLEAVSERRAALNGRIEGQVAEVNRLLGVLRGINGILGPGEDRAIQKNNEILDQRDQALTALNDIIPVSIVEAGSGQLTVTCLGQTLLDGGAVSTLESVLPSADGAAATVRIMENGHTLDLTRGTIAADMLVQTRNLARVAADYGALRDFLAGTGPGSLNARHASGFDLDGAPGAPALFRTEGNLLVVDPAIAASPDKLAAGASAATGDGRNAAALVAALDAKLPGGGTAQETLSRLYTSLAQDLALSRDKVKASEGLAAAAQERVDAASGVNLDEEATRMMQYQRTYQAVTRYISILDDLLNRLLSVGLGGG